MQPSSATVTNCRARVLHAPSFAPRPVQGPGPTELPNGRTFPNSHLVYAHLRVLLPGQPHDLPVLRENAGAEPDDSALPRQPEISPEETRLCLRRYEARKKR